ncbi:hypothetical protein DO72_2612 [Burkholderia pseudomallei]|nr:hypothetical protein DO72_2612 [Burkholderia pseudomallei]
MGTPFLRHSIQNFFDFSLRVRKSHVEGADRSVRNSKLSTNHSRVHAKYVVHAQHFFIKRHDLSPCLLYLIGI